MNDEALGKKKRRPYEAPAIIFEEFVEAIASTCGSAHSGLEVCRMSPYVCESTFN